MRIGRVKWWGKRQRPQDVQPSNWRYFSEVRFRPHQLVLHAKATRCTELLRLLLRLLDSLLIYCRSNIIRPMSTRQLTKVTAAIYIGGGNTRQVIPLESDWLFCRDEYASSPLTRQQAKHGRLLPFNILANIFYCGLNNERQTPCSSCHLRLPQFGILRHHIIDSSSSNDVDRRRFSFSFC